MSKILVVSYSRTGTTRKVAEDIVVALQADFKEVIDARRRRGWPGYLRSGFESIARGLPSIEADWEPKGYDLVVLGTPVWTGSMASPMRSFIFLHRAHLDRVACFCTMGGGRGARAALAEMTGLCGATRAPTFSATQADVQKGRHAARLREFIDRLEQVARGDVSAVA